MKKVFFTAGPTQIYPTVPGYIQNALDQDILSMSHRGAQFQQLFADTVTSLKKLLNIPEAYHIFFLGSATEAWERIIQNTVETSSFHFVNGAFAKRFYTVAQELGKSPQKIEVADGTSFEFEAVSIPQEAELLCFTHNESSTGVALNMKQVEELKKRFPDKLIAVDTVSSMPQVEIDYSLVDCVFFSVQKGFGLPAGLGVLIVSPQAMEKARYLSKKSLSIGSYHSFLALEKYAAKNQTPETPNVLAIYLLHKVIQDFLTIGINTVRVQTVEKAKLLHNFFEKSADFAFFVPKQEDRSQTVFVVEPEGGSKHLIDTLKKSGLIIGSGYGAYKETYVRVANFPAHSVEDIKHLIEAMEAIVTTDISGV